MISLPVDNALPDLLAAVRDHGAAVLTAPAGSGKTTRVPPALLDAVDGTVLVLQPRRVAARLAAQRIADERGWRIGNEVGWRIRFEDRTGPGTRLIVLTEGLLTRWMQRDPFLEGVGAVVLDELHERSVHADLALAMLQDVRAQARPDLVIVAMSATLDAAPVAAFLDAPVIEATGRTYPVDVRWQSANGWLSTSVAAAVRREIGDAGHVLVFLPGRRDIERCQEALAGLAVPVLPLHGGLSVAEQQRALAPSDRPKVVLATNVAETSVTLPDVAVVIDTGWVKVTRFDAKLGITRLVRERVSEASATQRAGRAGRTGPGRCVRLWNKGEAMAPFLEPELHRTDLASTLLEVWAWGATPETFPWFEPPPAAAVARAEQLLGHLGAVADGALTPLGRTLAALPVDPRLGAVIVAGHGAGILRAAAGAAALASEPDPFPNGIPGAAHGDDLLARLEVLDRARRVAKVRDQLVRVARRTLGPAPDRDVDPETLIRCLLAGFPDRLARRTGPGRYKLQIGAAELDPSSVVDDAPLVLAVGLRGGDRGQHTSHRISIACPVDPAWLDTTTVRELAFIDGAVMRRSQDRFAGTIIRERLEPAQDDALLAAHATVDHLTVDDRVETLLCRVDLLREAMPELGVAPVDLRALLPELCAGRRTLSQLAAVDVAAAVRDRLPWPTRQALDTHAPERLTLPSGSTARVRYTADGPVLGARVQQLFGWSASPRIANGRVAVTVELLSPANRPVQVTGDLAGFWAGTYADVRRDLRGRYPKHSWPEDPTTATAEDRPPRRRS